MFKNDDSPFLYKTVWKFGIYIFRNQYNHRFLFYFFFRNSRFSLTHTTEVQKHTTVFCLFRFCFVLFCLFVCFWVEENPKTPQFEPHAGMKFAEVLGSPLYICVTYYLLNFVPIQVAKLLKQRFSRKVNISTTTNSESTEMTEMHSHGNVRKGGWVE